MSVEKDPAYAAWSSLRRRGLIVFVPTRCAGAVYAITDTGRQALELHRLMEEE